MKNSLTLALFSLAVLAGCAATPPAIEPGPPAAKVVPHADGAKFLNRVTWGASAAAARELAELGPGRWLERQLRPPAGDDLPPEAAKQVAELTIVQRPLFELTSELAEKRRAYLRITDDPERRAREQRAYQQELQRLAREAGTRTVLRALYSPWQLREHLTWFWMNHFSVFAGKAEMRALVGDYEERAIRPHALGRFRDLLGASARHPAMMRYLDNAQNAAGRLNENYARELLELHTLGVDGGYSQKDVQELARVLTGFGLFEFSSRRHDYGAKTLLGEPIRASGAAGLDEALDRLARHPSTARFVSRKLAVFFVADEPPAALVDRLACVFLRSDGDIARVLEALFSAPEFEASLNAKFKDPVHYVFSSLRLLHGDTVISNPAQVLGWLGRLGQQLYARATPDGYPLTRREWSSAGQMATRFDVARQIGNSFPQLEYGAMVKTLSPGTLQTLEKAATREERNLLFLASPEFMHR